MMVERIVANLAASDMAPARNVYERALGLRIVMDHSWLQTFAAGGTVRPTNPGA